MRKFAPNLRNVSRGTRGSCGRFLAILLMASCTSVEPTPEGILDQERFTNVLLEATLLEARMNRELITEQRASVPMDHYYAELFTEKKMTQEEFERSFDHYAAHPDQMAAIYDDVLTELRRRKDEALQRPVVPLTKSDTLRTDSSTVRKL